MRVGALLAAALLALLGMLACRRSTATPPLATAVLRPSDASDTLGTIKGAAEGAWTLPGVRDAQQPRYSPLDQLTLGNVKDLKVAWTFSTGVPRGHEGNPLVVHNTMYVVTPCPNIVYAIDLTRSGGPLKWIHHPMTEPAAQGEASCDVVKRGTSYADGLIDFNRLDNHVVALDAQKGTVCWDNHHDSISRGSTMTMAPLIVKDRVVVGKSGGGMGVRGVAVYSGIGGWAGAVALGLSTDDPAAALGAVGGMTDLPNYTAPGNLLYAFGP